MGCESTSFGYQPFSIYYERRKPPKVFRRTFSRDRKTALLENLDKGTCPPNLIAGRVKDVTPLYIPAMDVRIQSNRLNGSRLAYICVFSNGNWHPAYWGEVKNNSCVFDKMARGIIYIISLYENYYLRPISSPFYISEEQRGIVELIISKKNTAENNIIIEYTQAKELDEQRIYTLPLKGRSFYDAMDRVKANKLRSKPMLHQKYTLFYYDNGWRLHSSVIKVKKKPLTFRNVPRNTIYKLLSGNSTGRERIFTYDDGKQTWW